MAAVVPSATTIISVGNRVGILATFGVIGATDVWTTGLNVVEAVFITDAASGNTLGATYSGGTVTFANSGSTTANTKVLAIGL